MKFTSDPASIFGGTSGEVDDLGMAPEGSTLRHMIKQSAVTTVGLTLGQLCVEGFKSYTKDRSKGVSLLESKHVQVDCYVRDGAGCRGLSDELLFLADVLDAKEKGEEPPTAEEE